ncbi:hypothetical protein RRG08_031385 [Elysia crispata]|uniref:Uncharacterized protein n=1 Tax=Elysia crispata TaxID=231223 RepID=A0AAE0ZP23_9GAST|nr:hypothetical protein RRG08_031385 [Elysia crispata]
MLSGSSISRLLFRKISRFLSTEFKYHVMIKDMGRNRAIPCETTVTLGGRLGQDLLTFKTHLLSDDS